MRARDRAVAGAVVVVVLLLAAGVIALVRDAEQSGIHTRQRLRTEQTRQQANSMDARVQAAFASLAGTVGSPGQWTMTPRSPEDAVALQPSSRNATSGSVLVDLDGVVVNGSLLRDSDAIGRRVTRPGLAAVLTGHPSVLPVAEGLTTTEPTVAIGIPVRSANGALAGAHLTEIEVTAESVFNVEIAELDVEDGSFSFIDEFDVVVASSDMSLLGHRLDDADVAGLTPGFHRADGRVAAVAEAPTAGWRLVFDQDENAFQGDLTTPLRLSLLLVLGAGALCAAVAAVLLLRRLEAAREEQRRLAQIAEVREDFTSIVSHELRTPVAGLLGFLQTAIDHWEVMPDDERRRAVQRAVVNARTLQALTSDVLDSASIEAQTLAYRFEAVDLRTVVGEAVAALREAAPERTVNAEHLPAPVWVRADAGRLAQVLANLLDNALRSSPADSPIDVVVASSGKEVTVRVRDRGPGIAPEEQEGVFEKFSRGRAGIGRGSGLALYISRHIVEAHGGRIWVDRADDGGATIAFSLPASDAPAPSTI